MAGDFVTISEVDNAVEALMDDMFPAVASMDHAALDSINARLRSWEDLRARILDGELISRRPAA